MQSSNDANHDKPFQKYYDGSDSQWGNSSGPGSDSFYTTDYRSLLSKFIRLNNISSVVDIGCGDWQFSRFIDFAQASYVGFDVVDDVVNKNHARYSANNVSFKVIPPSLEDVPSADLLIMKDVLQHLSDKSICSFRDLVFPKFRHCLLTNSFRKIDTAQNTDIVEGGFRCLDLTNPPYNLVGTYLLEFSSTVWEHIRVLHYVAQKESRNNTVI